MKHKCPLQDGRINKMWNIIQSEKGRKFCLPQGIMLGEISQITHKRTDTVSSHLNSIPREVEFRDRK